MAETGSTAKLVRLSYTVSERLAVRDELRRNYLDGAISKRRNLLAIQQAGRLARAEVAPDLISLLLLLNQSQAGSGWDTRQIASVAAFYLVAALDSTASLAPHLFHHLWHFSQLYPQPKNLLTDLTFLRTASTEALSLHLAIPAIFREATQAVELPGGLCFVAGQTTGYR